MPLATPFTPVLNGGEGPNQNVFVDSITFPGDTAYPTGGSVAFQNFFQSKATVYGGRRVLHVDGWAYSGGALYLLKYDRANNKLRAFVASTGAEVGDTTNMSSMTVNATVWSE